MKNKLGTLSYSSDSSQVFLMQPRIRLTLPLPRLVVITAVRQGAELRGEGKEKARCLIGEGDGTPSGIPAWKIHGQSLVGCSPWGREESDTTERLHFHFSLSCIGEGNGNPLQCSCLESPKDGGAWWAAVYGVSTGSDTTEVT